MDIVVTVPKSEYKNDDLETQEMKAYGYNQFWTLGKKPTKLCMGERVYFVKYGEIDSSLRVIAIEEHATKCCETTGRHWEGRCILTLDDLQDERHTQIKTKGFQGFRYKWWD